MAFQQLRKQLPLLVFCSLGIIWGSNFLYMKYAAKYISATQIVFLRVVLALIPILIYAWSTKSIKKAHLRYTHHFLVMSLLATVIYYFCFVKGASLLYSGVAGALSGSAPLFTFILGLIFLKEEKCTLNKVFGLILGALGIILLAKPFDAAVTTTTWLGIAYMLAGSLSFGASFIYTKKYISPLKIAGEALVSYQLLGAALILGCITDFKGIMAILPHTEAALGLFIGLSLLGTGLAYLIYYYLIDTFGAIKASSVAYIPPVVALLIGALLAQEPISLSDLLATALILFGVWLLKK
ncbi:DMT family transporter [Sphingobacterium sp. MYb382]|uniref:DMT family transporter n=1 Tax=Sphingobacterium sp. MYb382 TaxID=2745278 RepID=UPI0030ACFBA6